MNRGGENGGKHGESEEKGGEDVEGRASTERVIGRRASLVWNDGLTCLSLPREVFFSRELRCYNCFVHGCLNPNCNRSAQLGEVHEEFCEFGLGIVHVLLNYSCAIHLGGFTDLRSTR